MAPRFSLMTRVASLARCRFWGCVSGALLCSGAAATDIAKPAHWAFLPLARNSATAKTGPAAIDALVSSALAKDGRKLLPKADRRTLIRRLSFDLRGLPPSPEEIEAFLKESSPEAEAQWVERFLASPQYGERWGRHWLDLAGYADSNGYFSADSERPLAWKYRDYVIRSINADKPLDQFIREQIAGDEIVGYAAGEDVTPEMIDPLIATHFWRDAPDGTGESDGNPLEVKVDKYAVLEGSLQIFSSAFLGLTIQCARCHDHKFEPVAQREYYALQAILRPAFDPQHWLKPNERVIEIGTRAEREAHQRKTAEVERELKTLKDSLEGLTAPFRKQAVEENLAPLDATLRKAILKAFETKEKERNEAMKSLLKTNAALVELNAEALEKRFSALAAAARPLREAIKTKETEKPPPLEQIAATFETTNAPPAHHLFIRGNHANEGLEVEPGTPGVFRVAFPTGAPSAGRALASSGRRLALARWLTSEENPIVARALVNRVWHYHFGQGLAGTIDNLGQSGARPIHPELLDWLAAELIRSGWSLKHLHRIILNSAAWKQAPAPASEPHRSRDKGETQSATADYWSSIMQPRRLDAESLRDAMLAVSGELDLTSGGRSVPAKGDKQGQVVIDEKQPGARRRSIYLQQRRASPESFLSTFDGPAHNPVCVQRVSSTVALQSLTLLNSDFVRRRARAFARRILEQAALREKESGGGSAPAGTLQFAFELAYGRPAKTDELSAAETFLRDQAAAYAAQSEVTEKIWTDLCQMLLASNAFLYVD